MVDEYVTLAQKAKLANVEVFLRAFIFANENNLDYNECEKLVVSTISLLTTSHLANVKKAELHAQRVEGALHEATKDLKDLKTIEKVKHHLSFVKGKTWLNWEGL